MASSRRSYTTIFMICFIVASSSYVTVISSDQITAQLTDNDEVLNICIDNKVHAFHLDFLLHRIPNCYFHIEMFVLGSAGQNKTKYNKCCFDLMLFNTIRSAKYFTLQYKIINAPVKKDIKIVMTDAETRKVLDRVIFQRNHGSFKVIQVQQRKLTLQMTFPKSCFVSLMIIKLDYSTENCKFKLQRSAGSNSIDLYSRSAFCLTITFGNGKFLTNEELFLQFQMQHQIDENILVQLIFNKLIMGYSTTDGKPTLAEKTTDTPSEHIVPEETNITPNKSTVVTEETNDKLNRIVASSSSDKVDNPYTQVYLKLPLLEEMADNMYKFSVVVAHSSEIISKRGTVHQTDKFIDKTYEECQIYQYYQQQQQRRQQNIWNGCVYEVNITDAVSGILYDAPLNYVGFVLGAMDKCSTQHRYFCNGPLQPGYTYNVSLRVYSRPNGKYETIDPVEVTTQIDSSFTSLIKWSVISTGMVVIILVVLIIIIVVCCINKKRRNKHQIRDVKETRERYLGNEGVYTYIKPETLTAATAATSSSNIRAPSNDRSAYSVIDESQEPYHNYMNIGAVPQHQPDDTIDEEDTDIVANTVELSNVYEINVAPKLTKQDTTAV